LTGCWPTGGKALADKFSIASRIAVKHCLWLLRKRLAWLGILSVAAQGPLSTLAGLAPCRIEVVEKGRGWPVPLVELRTLHQVRFVTDNAGLIAFDLPELMGRETWFDVIADGYEVPKDGFGYRGVRLLTAPGKSLRVEVQRTSMARCMGRLTGGGIFGESQKLGLAADWHESGILGCDSVQTAVYRGRLFWIWGDTILPSYPLGIFNSSSATTSIEPLQSLEPPLRLPFDYFTGKNGVPRGVADVPGEGPTWITGCVSLPDEKGVPHLVASYMKTKHSLQAYQWGLVAWDGMTSKLMPLRVLWNQSDQNTKAPPVPEGHATFWSDETGKRWVLFGDPFPALRCPAAFEAWSDPAAWEVLKPQKTVLAAGDGAAIRPHRGSIAWSPWRKRFVTIFTQKDGHPSALGEIWYAESDSPAGPWGPAVKVLSHEHYTFYNPMLHPELTPAGSPILFFEGTYSMDFSDAHQRTPRYDYNQVLYRLDLDELAKMGITN
jgi:hypothetical protein